MRTLALFLVLVGCDPDSSRDAPDAALGELTDAAIDDVAIDDAAIDDAAPDAPACVEYQSIHLHASMQRTDTVAERQQAIDKAFVNGDGTTPDTITWTEIETQAQIDRIHNRAGWATNCPNPPANPDVHPANAVPISWRTNVYQFVDGSSLKASDGLAGVSPHRYVTRVRLRHIASGAQVMRVGHHAVSGVDNPQDNIDYRLAAHAQDIAAFNERMLGAAHPVIGGGDFNTTRLRALLAEENDGTQPFRFDVPATGGSHGARLIDYVVRRKSDGDVYVLGDTRFVDLAPSDHRGVRATYTYRPAPCTP